MEWNSGEHGTAKRVIKNGQIVYVAQPYQPDGSRFAAFRSGRRQRHLDRFGLYGTVDLESLEHRRRLRNARKMEARANG